MQKLLGSLTLALVAPSLAAQCINPVGTSYGTGDDFVANAGAGINIGFAFPIGGVTFDHVHPSSNGFFYLSDGTPTLTNSDLSPSEADMYSNEPRVAVFWEDLVLDAGTGDLLVDTSVPGQCTITWSSARLFGGTNYFSVNCVLDVSGIVTFNFDNAVEHNSALIVGVSPGNGAATQPASVDLSAGLPTSDDMTHEMFATAGTFDMAGTQLQLIPTLPGYLPLTGSSGCATKQTFGLGCNLGLDAGAELFAAGAQDVGLTGTTITFVRSATGYTVLDSIPGTYVAPTAGTVISVNDDAFGTVPLSNAMPYIGGTTTALSVCTNGYISLSGVQSSANADWSPTEAEFLAFTEPTICGPWYDWSPNTGGQLVYEEVGTTMYVTWDAVPAFGAAATPDTLQYQFDELTGNVTIVYQTMNYAGTSTWHTPMFGYTNGAPQAYQSLDLSTLLPAGLPYADVPVLPLSIDSNLPVIGTTWDITTTNVEAISPVAAVFFGDTKVDPGVPLSSVPGFNAPGCTIYTNGNLYNVQAANVGGTAVTSLNIPNNPGFVGTNWTLQSVCLTLSNPSLLLLSNGLEVTLGN